MGEVVFRPLDRNEGSYVRTDAGGFQILINYRGGHRHFETVSMTDILEDRVDKNWGRDRIILIGKVGETSKDLFFTPHSGSLVDLPQLVSGVEIHANLTSQIISAALENRPLIKSLPDPLEWLWIVLWVGVGAGLSWRLRYVDGIRFISWRKWSGFMGLVGLQFGATFLAFSLDRWWLPAAPGLLALSTSTFAITAYTARTAISIRKTFGRYLTDQVVAQLLESPSGLQLGGERRQLTLLTSDLRGFTAMAEGLPPEEVIKIINFYLGNMAEVITKYQGTIDEFMGDGILVLFGAPTSGPDDPERAIACALEMQLVMAAVNQQMEEWGFSALEMGIGIHTGEVVVGNIGSEKRAKYGVVGANVNLTYRIESYTTGGQILISQATYDKLDHRLRFL
jgi:adenylate cyclase